MAALTLEFVVFAIFVKLTAWFLIQRFSKAIALFLILGAGLCILLGMTDIDAGWNYLTFNLVATLAGSVVIYGIQEIGMVGLSAFSKFK